MDWTPISAVDLWDLAIKADARMSPQLSKLWHAIKITPQKWSEQSHGLVGGGFWVVALVGENAIMQPKFYASSSRRNGSME